MGGTLYDICHDHARQPLAVAHDDLQGTWRQVMKKHHAFVDVAEFIEHKPDNGSGSLPPRGGYNAVDHFQMAVDDAGIRVEIGDVVGHGKARRGDKQVGDASQG